MIYICIPVFNRYLHTKKCLNSLRSQSYINFTTIVCDDGSTDSTATLLSIDFPEVVVLKGNGNLWWAGATNVCVKYALQTASFNDFIFTLNNDTVLEPDTLLTLIRFSEKKPQCIVSCGNYFENEPTKIESTAFKKRNKSPFSLYHQPLFIWGQDVRDLTNSVFEINAVAGKGVLIPVAVFKKVGFYNDKDLPQYHSDTEFSYRANEAGFKIFINLNAKIYTDQNASGMGQINSNVSLNKFFFSLFSLKSNYHLKTLYNRSKLVYKKKWRIYFIANVLVIILNFFKRFFRKFFNKIIK